MSCALHAAGRSGSPTGPPRPARGGRAGRHGPRRRTAIVGRDAHVGDPDHRPFHAAAHPAPSAARLSDLKLFLREEPSGPRASVCTTDEPIACCSPSPMPVARLTAEPLFDDRLFVAFPPTDEDVTPPAAFPRLCDRRGAAAAGGRALPEGPCAGRLQTALTARRGDDAGHVAPHHVQMVDNGLGMTMLPEMALRSGILDNTQITARPLDAENAVAQDRAGLASRQSAREGLSFAAQLLAEAA